MNTTQLKKLYPALSASQSTAPVHYFDSAATACMPESVCDVIDRTQRTLQGGVHRGLYQAAEQATAQYELVRAKVARFLGASSPESILFTAGATDSCNAIMQMWALHNIHVGDLILVTQAAHHAEFLVWQEVARRTGAELAMVPIDPYTFQIDMDAYEVQLARKPRVVSLIMNSNVVGPIWGADNEQLYRALALARAQGAVTVIDAAQSAPHEPVDVVRLKPDFLFFSVHKMGGPTGVGVLYGDQQVLQACRPYRFGGGMVSRVDAHSSSWLPAPHCFEAGTPPLAQVLGLGAVLDFYDAHVAWNALREHEARWSASVLAALQELSGVHVVGNQQLLERQGHLVSFYLDGMHAHDVADLLHRKGFAVRAGDHCAQPLMALWGYIPTVRVSFHLYITDSDVAELCTALRTLGSVR